MSQSTGGARRLTLFNTRYLAGEWLYFGTQTSRGRRWTEPEDALVVTLGPGGVPIGFTWAFFGSRELREVDPGGGSCPWCAGRDVVIADDGMSHPERIAQAAAWLRAGGARRIDVAVPIADDRLPQLLDRMVDFLHVEHHVPSLPVGLNLFEEPVPRSEDVAKLLAELAQERSRDEEEEDDDPLSAFWSLAREGPLPEA